MAIRRRCGLPAVDRDGVRSVKRIEATGGGKSDQLTSSAGRGVGLMTLRARATRRELSLDVLPGSGIVLQVEGEGTVRACRRERPGDRVAEEEAAEVDGRSAGDLPIT